MMSDFLTREEVGIIAVEQFISPQESLLLNQTTNQTSNLTNITTPGGQQFSLPQDVLMAYIRDLTRVGYENYFTVYSQDYRLYLAENQLRLTKKYLRFVLDEMSTMQKEIYELA